MLFSDGLWFHCLCVCVYIYEIIVLDQWWNQHTHTHTTHTHTHYTHTHTHYIHTHTTQHITHYTNITHTHMHVLYTILYYIHTHITHTPYTLYTHMHVLYTILNYNSLYLQGREEMSWEYLFFTAFCLERESEQWPSEGSLDISFNNYKTTNYNISQKQYPF